MTECACHSLKMGKRKILEGSLAYYFNQIKKGELRPSEEGSFLRCLEEYTVIFKQEYSKRCHPKEHYDNS